MPESVSPTMCRREFAGRAQADAPQGHIVGIGVPYGVVISPDPEGIHVGETFDAGSVTMHEDGTKVFWRHYEPIGRMDSITDSAEGPVLDSIISDTTAGRDALTLARDEVVNQWSIGWRWDESEFYVDEAGIRHWTRVPAREFSLVPFGAYGAGASASVRQQKETTMPDLNNPTDPTGPETLTRADLDPINAALDELKRSAALSTRGGHAPTMSRFPTMAHFVKAIASGDEDAAELHRAYTGATTADTIMKDTFIGDFIRLVTQRRRIVNKFSRDTLPSGGLSVDYYQLDTDTTAIGKQEAEGDNLPYGQIKLKTANSPVSTYGGWTEMSRQAIERATYAALNVTLRAMALKYGQVTEAAARAVYLAQIEENLADGKPHVTIGATVSAATSSQWIDAIIDAAEYYEANGYVIDGLDVSKDIFKVLANLKDGSNRLMKVYGDGVNQIGELNLSKLSGNLAGVKCEMIPLADDGTASFYDPVAITTLESPGAPAQLQDENIINLSKQFSMYGFAAEIVPFSAAIYPVKFGA